MESQDENQFKQLLVGVSEIYGKTLTPIMIKAYWSVLKGYSIDQVDFAFNGHLVDVNHGTFFPKPADLIRQLSGKTPTHDEILSAARLHKTPLGVLCRIHIGDWDLNNQHDMFYLKQRAQECLDLLPEWKAMSELGEYTDHQLIVMDKYGVSPSVPLYDGLPPPSSAVALSNRLEALRGTERHALMLAPPAPEVGDDEDPLSDESKEKFSKVLNNIFKEYQRDN